ncbi:MAG: GAF domain-containing protein [Blautia sp.]|nr:GAF domain-containing protein [Blautia sp.]
MTNYALLCDQLEEFLKEEPFYVPALSNASALLMDTLPDLNWAGFYLIRGERLVVGPFQGRPACIHIPVGKGVCGTAVKRNETVLVPDVHAFPGHIACDSASNSEIVVPIHDNSGSVLGVMDIDSPRMDRFSQDDREGLERFVTALEKHLMWKDPM